jgi:hypothetical protein
MLAAGWPGFTGEPHFRTPLAGPSEALKRIRPSFATSAVRLNRSAAARLHSQRLDTGDRFTFR